MDDQGLHIGHIGQKGKDRQMVDEGLCRLRVPLDLEGEDGPASFWQIFLIELMGGLALQGRVMDGLYLGMAVQIVHQL